MQNKLVPRKVAQSLCFWASFAYDQGFCPVELILGEKYPGKGWRNQSRTEDNLKNLKKAFVQKAEAISTVGGGFGIVTGIKSGVVIVDIDIKNKGVERWQSLLQNHELPNTLSVITGTGGFHYYFKYDEKTKNLTNRTNALGDNSGIDIRTEGGQVVFIGSIHPTALKAYEPNFKVASNGVCEIATMPDWLYGMLIKNETYSIKSSPIKKEMTDLDCIHQVKLLLSLLNSDIVEDYDKWIKVGMCLHNGLGDKGKELWIEWSKQSSKFKVEEMDYKWNSFGTENNQKKLSLASLHFWASKSNPSAHRKCFSQYVIKIDPNEKYYLDNLIQDIDFSKESKEIFDNSHLAYMWMKERISKCLRIVNSATQKVMIKSDEQNLYTLVCQSTFISQYGNMGVLYKKYKKKDEPPEINICSIWKVLNTCTDLKFRELVYYPYHEGRELDRVINTFPGYKAKLVESVNMNLIDPILYHLKEVLASGNEEYYQYLLTWLAFCFQKPLQLPEIMITFYGEVGGEGKSLFIDWLLNCFFGEKNYIKLSGVDELRNWTGVIENKIIVWIDELVSMDSHGSGFH